MGNYRPINGYVDTHIFTFSTCRIYCIKDLYILVTTVMGNYMDLLMDMLTHIF